MLLDIIGRRRNQFGFLDKRLTLWYTSTTMGVIALIGRGSPEKLEGDLIRQNQRCAVGDQSMAEGKPLPRQ